MKTLLTLMIILVLAICIAVPVLAANVGDNASQWCNANDDLGYQKHGECVRLVTLCYGPGNTGPVCVCKTYLDTDPVGFYTEYNNLGECISHLRDGYVASN